MLRDVLFRLIHYKTTDNWIYLVSLLRGLGDGCGSLQSRLSFLGNAGQEFLDLGDSAAGVETLGTSLGAVHDGVAPATMSGY